MNTRTWMTILAGVGLVGAGLVACSSDEQTVRETNREQVVEEAPASASAAEHPEHPAPAAAQARSDAPAPAPAARRDPPPKQPPPTPAAGSGPPIDPAVATVDLAFSGNSFPPIIPDTDWHQDAWLLNDCLRCHETGVEDAPMLRHTGLPPIALHAKCRTCHVLIPGAEPRERPALEASIFDDNAFPPMMPASEYHEGAWLIDDCLLCHEDGILGATKLVHQDLPLLLKRAKCRTCHVQVRAIDADPS